MTPVTEFIVLYQHREERTGRSPSGEPFYHTVVDFLPLHTKHGPHTCHASSHEMALTFARQAYPSYLLAVQPLQEFLQCHQKPKPSQRSLRPSAQRLGS